LGAEKKMTWGFIKKILEDGKIKSLLKKSRIGATTDLAILNVERNSESLKIYDSIREDFIKTNNHFRGGVGERYITIILGEQYLENVYNSFEKHLVSYKKNVGMITIECPDSYNTYGIIAYISAIIYKKDINLHGFFTSQNEHILVLDEEKVFEYVEYLKKQLGA
jgi:hypothetical protein